MQFTESNPPLTPLLRAMTLIEVIVLAAAGIGLFFLPDIAATLWPWELTPFNTRFLGAIYLAAMTAVGLMLRGGRWYPARPVVWTIFSFTVVVLVVSILNTHLFDFSRWGTWLWFALYIALPINCIYHLWLYRRVPTNILRPTSSVLRYTLLIFGGALGLYGVGLLVAPLTFTSFWPWALDEFHAQLYSATFFSGAFGLITISRATTAGELGGAGVTQGLLGVLALVGLVIVNAQVNRVNWSYATTWLWVGMFAAMALTSLILLAAARRWNQHEAKGQS